MVKSITSTLAAAAVQDGLIGGLDDPVTKYLPQLRHSAYDGASIRNVLQMASGVRWNETYTDPSSDRRKMLDLQTQQRPGALLRFMATLPRAARPGTEWNYNTGETYVLGAVVRAAVKRPLSQFLSEKIWSSFAMEQDATWWTGIPWGSGVWWKWVRGNLKGIRPLWSVCVARWSGWREAGRPRWLVSQRRATQTVRR
jgi:CubicO group peptidase (beta-lactamase class C family)